MKRKLLALLGSLALALTGSVAIAAPAQADDNGELPSCFQWHFIVGHNGQTYTGSGDWYAYSDTVQVPSASACEDIQITDQIGDVWHWRVRFYPSSGGNYANSWKGGQCSFCVVVIATNVSNGTRFRVEGHKLGAGGLQTVYQRNAYLKM